MRRILWPRLVCLLAVVAITLSFHLRPVQPLLLDPAQPTLSDTRGLESKAIAEQGTAKQEIRSGSAAHRAVPRGADDPLALPAIAASRPAGIGKPAPVARAAYAIEAEARSAHRPRAPPASV